MIRAFLDFSDRRNGKTRPPTNFFRVALWNLSQLRHRFDRQQLDFQPDPEFARVGPNLSHLWPGIAIDHSAKIRILSLISKMKLPCLCRIAGEDRVQGANQTPLQSGGASSHFSSG